MAKFVSYKSPVSTRSLKRKSVGAVVRHHSAWETVKFTRVHGGWLRSREDFNGLRPELVTSAAVANECNRAYGCADSWAKVY